MKKNKMMRLASVLLVLTLLSTSVISGTFAKYVSSGKANDSARVAKWGVVVDASGSLFGAHYNENTNSSEETDNKIAVTSTNVASFNGDNIVAPGTESDKGLTLAISGKPEVASSVTFTYDTDIEEIWLKAQLYGVLVKTDAITEDNFADIYGSDTISRVFYSTDGQNFTYVHEDPNSPPTYPTGNVTWYYLRDYDYLYATDIAGEDDGKYYPLKWTVASSNQPTTTVNCIKDMQEYITSTSVAAPFSKTSYEANSVINANVTISWEWPFESQNPQGTANNDHGDTILGDLMAAKDATVDYVVVKSTDGTDFYHATKAVEGEDYNLEVKFGATITVEQVD